jgi:predicted O-linked N-acetylglucosamine transferase (SPINDLY family)
MAEPLPSRHDDAIVVEAADYAVKFHQLGMLAEAEQFYDAILKVKPDHFKALHLLGVLRQQQGNRVEALRLTSEALAANSRSADALCTFGAVLDALERHEEALAAYDQALAMEKDRAEALVSHGIALVQLGRNQEALEAFDGALAIKEHHLEARINRGVALTHLGRVQEALEAFDGALAINEHHPEALVSRGVALLHLGRVRESLAAFDKAIEVQPDHAMALSNRVLALLALGRHGEVLDCCDRALAVNPRDAETLYIRGNTLWRLGRLEYAIDSYEQAWALNHARALSMLALYRLTIADWVRAGKLSEVLSARIAAGDFIYPFTSVVFGFDPLDQLKAAKNYLRVCLPVVPKPFGHSTGLPADKLRIAYVSSDFRQHAVASAIAELFERHDRTRFEIVGVSLSPDDASGIRTRIVSSFDRFHDVAADTDANIAKLLDDLQVHIAVDLNGPTQGSRPGVWAYRGAPLQVVYLGYPATTGAEYIDYILADETVLPFEEQPFFTERIVHLPDCYHANDATRRISTQTPARSALGLPDQGLVFCCFNKSSKITGPVFGVWMRLLAQVPGSVLWLSGMNDLAQANLRREAAARSVDPQRLIFAPHVDRVEDHLARHRAADLFLDTLPYNAHSTAIDALWAGLPVVTCIGTSFAGRVGASLLKAAGLPELVTNSLADYEVLALRLAADPALLPSIRRKLDNNRLSCRLFDSDRFCRHVEAAYTTMWDIHRNGDRPRGFRVEPST